MLTKILDLTGQFEPDVFDVLYPYFQRDFITNKTNIAGSIYVDPACQGMKQGKENTFWHITTREKKKKVIRNKKQVEIKTRPYDPERGCRIEWVRPILLNHDHAEIKLFYRKETKGKKPVRLYFWAHNHDFIVIVQKLGRSRSYLVTSFYITEPYKRASYQKWFDEYVKGQNAELQGCEWF